MARFDLAQVITPHSTTRAAPAGPAKALDIGQAGHAWSKDSRRS